MRVWQCVRAGGYRVVRRVPAGVNCNILNRFNLQI